MIIKRKIIVVDIINSFNFENHLNFLYLIILNIIMYFKNYVFHVNYLNILLLIHVSIYIYYIYTDSISPIISNNFYYVGK